MRICLAIAIVMSWTAFTPPAEAEPFDKCGMLYTYGGCVWFYPFDPASQDRLVLNPPSRLPYPARVVGEEGACSDPCKQHSSQLCIMPSLVEECPSEDLGCGVFAFQHTSEGVECFLWKSDSLGTVLMSRDDVSGFSLGDTLHATGVIGYWQISLCGKPQAFAKVALTPCATSPVQVSSATWGRLKALYR